MGEEGEEERGRREREVWGERWGGEGEREKRKGRGRRGITNIHIHMYTQVIHNVCIYLAT